MRVSVRLKVGVRKIKVLWFGGGGGGGRGQVKLRENRGYKTYIQGWGVQSKGCREVNVTERIVISLLRLGLSLTTNSPG